MSLIRPAASTRGFAPAFRPSAVRELAPCVSSARAPWAVVVFCALWASYLVVAPSRCTRAAAA
eukprot:14592972-Alexandrium_andersonii.AAC.1